MFGNSGPPELENKIHMSDTEKPYWNEVGGLGSFAFF